MSIYPDQTRTVDPFSDFNSNSTNKLTRLVTRNTNCLHAPHAIDVTIDSTGVSVANVTTGQCFKDDVLIEITADSTADLSDVTFYISDSTAEDGYHYICLDYTYSKIQPVPQASIKILRPSERGLLTSQTNYLFLKAAYVVGGLINNVFDFDPENPSNKRNFSQLYAGLEYTLPSFVQTNDEGRLIYVTGEKEFYYGTDTGWKAFTSAAYSVIDTTSCVVGQLAYINSETGEATPAIATSNTTLCNVVVSSVGTIVGETGKVKFFGQVGQVPIESGITINYGDKLYLSTTDSGSVTNIKPTAFAQYVGVSSSTGAQTTSCNMWFTPEPVGSGGGSGDITAEDLTYHFLLDSQPFSKMYYDKFIVDTSMIESGTPLPSFNFVDDNWSGQSGSIVTSPELISDSTGVLYKFMVSADYDSATNMLIEYTINDGTSWVSCVNNVTTNVLASFTTLKLRFTWQGTGDFNSFGVLYDENTQEYVTNTRWHWVYTLPIDSTASFDVEVPNRYIIGENSLEIYRNGIKQIINVHYTEVDYQTVRFLDDMLAGERLEFLEYYGKVDENVENYNTVQDIITGHQALEKITLNDTTGSTDVVIQNNNGVVAIDGRDIVDVSSSQTLTNKNIDKVMRRIGVFTVDTTAMTSITIGSGGDIDVDLNGDTDVWYQLKMFVVNNSGSDTDILLQINADGGTNYAYNGVDAILGVQGVFYATNGTAWSLTPGGSKLDSGTLRYHGIIDISAARSLTFLDSRHMTANYTLNGKGSLETGNMGGVWANGADEIISLTISAVETGGLGLDTRIEIWAER